MKAVLLQYNFMFDPAEVWNSLYDFEQDLYQFFNSRNLNAEMIKSIEGQNGIRICLVSKKSGIIENVPVNSVPRGRPQTPQGKLRELKMKIPKAPERDFGKKKLKIEKIFNKVKKK